MTAQSKSPSRRELNRLADSVYNANFPGGPITEKTAAKVREMVHNAAPEATIVSYGYGRVALQFQSPPHRELTNEEAETAPNGVVIKIAYANCSPGNDDGSLQNSTELYCYRDANISIPIAPLLDYQEICGRPNWVMMPYRGEVPGKDTIREVVESNLEYLPETDDLYRQSSWGETESGGIECIDYGRLDP